MAQSVCTSTLIITTVSTVRTAGSALESVCSLLSEESQESPDLRVKLLLFELENVGTKLTEWQELWSPQDLQSEASFLLLWGHAGQREIGARLDNIQRPAIAISKQVEILKNTIQSKEELARSKGPRSWFRWLFSLPSLHNNDHTVRELLNESVAELVSFVTELQTSTNTHFRSMQGTVKGAESEFPQLDQVLASRAISNAIYVECERQAVDFDLDLNLLNNEHDIDKFPEIFDWRDLTLGYHLVFPLSSPEHGTRHLRLESTASLDILSPGTDSSQPTPYDDPLHLTQYESDLAFDCSLGQLADVGNIQLKGESRLEFNGSQVESNTRSQSEAAHQSKLYSSICCTSLAQKVYLAYRITEAGLFLIGTPWFSHLSLTSLVWHQHLLDSGQCSLHIDFGAPHGNRVSPQHMLDRQHIHQIGILLVELAIGSSWLEEDDNLESVPHDVAEQVKAEVNSTYGDACKQCFAIFTGREGNREGASMPTESATANVSTKLLEMYYTRVFLKLRNCLHDIM